LIGGAVEPGQSVKGRAVSKHRLSHRVLVFLAQLLDHKVGWDRLPTWLGIPTLVGLRKSLREHNLFDTGVAPAKAQLADPRWLRARSPDGTYNDLDEPAMGARGVRFGRNVPLERTYPQSEPSVLQPSPRIISERLLGRDELIPARGVNALVAAWLQFEVHDWFSHGKNLTENPWRVPLPEGDQWHQNPMEIQRTKPDPSYDPTGGGPPTYVSDDSHWWDGSQIYGTDAATVEARRGEDGKLRLDDHGLIPEDLISSADLSGVAGNAWLGLAVLHVLFSREHNAIVEMLHETHPELSDDDTFDRARLINAALMAKIHTVEWTPAVISHPATQRAMKINWWGLTGERFTRRFGRLMSGDLVSGIPGSATDHNGVPYSLTEEFVAVYRMHPLLPDDYTFTSVTDNSVLANLTFPDLDALHMRQRLEEFGMANVLYSFGRTNPGVICLHNYPRSLQHFHRPDGQIIDLAATDVLRVRERGVPLYNEFRRLLGMKAPTTFEELTSNRDWAQELRDVYDGDIESVDLMVGNYAERLPKGFAFSDTAFRIFILMASRRLKSDRFFTTDYRPGRYTEEGLRWVADNTLISVLLRHFPELAPSLDRVENGFHAWHRVGG
jgi:Animal haem peroxidase